MVNIYYITSSGTVITSYEGSNTVDNVFQSSSLQLTASIYISTTGSITSSIEVAQVSIQSGSTVYALIPLQNASIYYNINPPYYPLDPSDVFTPESASFGTLVEFTSNDISESIFKVSNTTKSALLVSSSDITYAKYLPITRQDTITVELSGSGDFYTSEIQVIDTVTNKLVTSTTGTTTPITSSFVNTTANRYSIIVNTTTQPYISMSFSSSTSIPVSPTSSIAAWNTFFQTTGSNSIFSASIIQNASNNVALAGGNLQTITGSLILEGINLTNFYSSNLTGITSYSLYNNKLTAFPNVVVSASAIGINLNNNLIVGSVPTITPNLTLQQLSIANNRLSGSIPSLSGSLSLKTFDVNNNYITGSIGSNLHRCYNLEYFDASNNQLSGSLTLFDLSGNAFTNIGNIQHFDISSNSMTNGGNTIDISFLSAMKHLDVSNNRLSGSISSFSNYRLQHFNCSSNNFSGSIPVLQTVELEFSPNGTLQYYNISGNSFTGTIDLNDYRYTLQTFIANNNKLNNYVLISGSYTPIYNELTTFNAQNNLLTSGSIDNILLDLDASGIVSGTVNLSGSGNQPPTTTGLAYTSSLKTKGWTVYVN